MGKSMMWLLGIGGAILLALLLTMGSYNSLVSLDQGVQGEEVLDIDGVGFATPSSRIVRSA